MRKRPRSANPPVRENPRSPLQYSSRRRRRPHSTCHRTSLFSTMIGFSTPARRWPLRPQQTDAPHTQRSDADDDQRASDLRSHPRRAADPARARRRGPRGTRRTPQEPQGATHPAAWPPPCFTGRALGHQHRRYSQRTPAGLWHRHRHYDPDAKKGRYAGEPVVPALPCVTSRRRKRPPGGRRRGACPP